MKSSVFLLPVMLLLAGCGGITSGVVVAKQYTAPYSYTYYEMQCFAYDTTGGCTVNMPMPMTEDEPECYELDLRNQDKTGSVCVDQATYNKINIGDRYGSS